MVANVSCLIQVSTGILQQYSNNTPTILQQYSNNTPTILQQYSNNTPTILQQYSNNTATILQQYSNNTPTILQQYLAITYRRPLFHIAPLHHKLQFSKIWWRFIITAVDSHAITKHYQHHRSRDVCALLCSHFLSLHACSSACTTWRVLMTYTDCQSRRLWL